MPQAQNLRVNTVYVKLKFWIHFNSEVHFDIATSIYTKNKILRLIIVPNDTLPYLDVEEVQSQ